MYGMAGGKGERAGRLDLMSMRDMQTEIFSYIIPVTRNEIEPFFIYLYHIARESHVYFFFDVLAAGSSPTSSDRP